MCLQSGQVFRWQEVQPGIWEGVDGEHWYRIQSIDSGFQVVSNVGAGEFAALFRLELPLDELHRELLARGPELATHLDQLKGLRLMHPSSPHETLFCFLCTANNHLSRITQMVRKLAAYGEPLSNGATRFPSAERIAGIEEAELRAAGFGYRARTIPEVARQILLRREGWLDSLRRAPYEEARKELMALPSIGPKLADCIALYGLQHLEATPMDTHLWQAICRLYYPEWSEKPLTESRYRQASEFLRDRFGKFAGFAHQFLYFENLLNWRKRQK